MTTAYPLSWPSGWPRSSTRKRARFSTGERDYRSSYITHKQLSIAEAIKRVLFELTRLGVEDEDAIVSTNLQLRLDGLPRSSQSEPDDPGAAVALAEAVRNASDLAEKINTAPETVVVPVTPTPAMLTRMVEAWTDAHDLALDLKLPGTVAMECIWDAAITAAKGVAA